MVSLHFFDTNNQRKKKRIFLFWYLITLISLRHGIHKFVFLVLISNLIKDGLFTVDRRITIHYRSGGEEIPITDCT